MFAIARHGGITSLAAALGLLAPLAQAQPPDEPPTGAVRYFDAEWEFDDVDVATLTRRLARVGLELPVSLAGRISGSLSVGIPWGALNNGRAWRLGGTLASPRLAINGFVLRDVAVSLQYRDGVLRLEQLAIRVPQPGDDARAADGVLTGVAAMELLPRGRFTASPRLLRFPLESLAATFEPLRGLQGRLSGSLDAAVEVDRLADPAAWRVTGPATLEGFRFQGIPPAQASVQFTLEQGLLTARQFILETAGVDLRGDGRLSLAGHQPWSLSATLAAGSLAQLLQAASGLVEEEQLAQIASRLMAGPLRGAAELAGTLTPPAATRIAGRVELAGATIDLPALAPAGLPLRPLTIERLAFNYAIVDQTLQLTQIDATVAGGRIGGAVTLPRAAGPLLANVQWTGVQLGAALAEPIGAGASSGTLALTIPAGAERDLARWEARLGLAVSELTYRGWRIADLQSGPVTLSGGRLQAPAVAAQVDGAPATLSLDLRLNAPKTVRVAFNLPQVPLGLLQNVPQLAAVTVGLEGVAAIRGELAGTWQPLQLEGAGRVVTRNVRFRGHTVDALEFDFTAAREAVNVSALRAQLYGGAAAGAAQLQLGEAFGLATQLEWSNVDAGRLLRGVELGPVALAGPSSGSLELAIPPGALEHRQHWAGVARLQLAALNVYDWQFRQMEPIDLRLAEGRLAAPNLRAVVDGGPFQAAAELEIVDDWSLEVRGGAAAARLERIAAIPALSFLRGRLGGVVDFRTHVRGPLSPVRLSASGNATGRGLRYDELTIDQASFMFDYRPESLTVSQVAAAAYGGRLTGTATLPLADESAGAFDVAWNGVDAAAATRLLGPQPVAVVGRSSGQATLAIPAGQWNNRRQWSGQATIVFDQVLTYTWLVSQIDPIQVRLTDGVVEIPAINALVDGRPLGASLRLSVTAPFEFVADVELNEFQLERFASIPQWAGLTGRVAGVANVTANLRGTLDPATVTATGRLAAHGLRWDAQTIERLALNFNLTAESLILDDIQAAAYGGQATGRAVVPLDSGGGATATLAWNNVDLGPLAAGLGELPFPLEATSRGQLQLQIPPGSLGRPAAWEFAAELALPDMRSGRTRLASVIVAATQQAGRLTYRAEGQLLGGVLQLRGERPAGGGGATGMAALGSAQLSLRDARLTPLARLAADPREQPAPLEGRLSLDLQTQAVPSGWSWAGDLRLAGIRSANGALTDGVTLRVQGDQQSVRLVAASGELAGGTLSGSGDWQSAPDGAGALRLSLRGADLEQLSRLATGQTNPPAAGPVDVELLVRPGTLWRIAGTIASPRLAVNGMTLRSVRVPIDVAWHPPSGRLELRLPGIHASLAGGRATGRLAARRSVGWTLDGTFRFMRVDFTALTGSTYGRGRLSGTLELKARNARSVNDLQAVLRADLEDTQAASIPLVTQMAGFVPGLASSASTFSDGVLEARLSRGVVRIQELSLASSQLQLYVTGRATLAGRLDLEAVVSTGDPINALVAERFLARLALATIPSASLLIEANALLADRTIHLAIGGTWRRPSIRVLPLATLREEVVRFFLRRAAGAVVPAAAGIGGARDQRR